MNENIWEDMPHKFWKEFIEADTLKRKELIYNLPVLMDFKDTLPQESSILLGFDFMILSLFEDFAGVAIEYYNKN